MTNGQGKNCDGLLVNISRSILGVDPVHLVMRPPVCQCQFFVGLALLSQSQLQDPISSGAETAASLTSSCIDLCKRVLLACFLSVSSFGTR